MLSPRNSLGFALNVAARQMKRMLDQRLGEFGLTATQYVTLWCLWECGEELPLTQLSKRMYLDNPTTSGIVDRMERDGFLERVQDRNDRRVINVRLTKKSLALRKQISDIGEEIDRATARMIDKELYHQVLDFLRKIARNDHEEK